MSDQPSALYPLIFTGVFLPFILDPLYRLAAGCAVLYSRDDWEMSFVDYLREVRKEAAVFFRKPFARAVFRGRGYYLFMAAGTAQGLVAQWFLADPLKGALASVFGALLLSMSYVDFRTRYLPDALMTAALLFSLPLAVSGIFLPWRLALGGGAAGFLLMWGINEAFKRIRKKDGMGFGDIKLMGVLGLWIGPFALPYVLFLSSFIGLAGALAAAAITRSKTPDKFAYGPALALAGWAALIYGSAR